MLNRIFSFLTGAPVEKVADYFVKKQELKQQLRLKKLEREVRLEEARIQLAETKVRNDHDWELAQIANSGWKDELVLILLSIPLVLVFVPFTADTVLQGFTVLETTPDWYRWLIMLIFTATYGIRIWRRKDNNEQ